MRPMRPWAPPEICPRDERPYARSADFQSSKAFIATILMDSTGTDLITSVRIMSPFLAEFIGTMLLVVLGDGVVANVLLTKSKGQNSGWIVITTGWALGVAVAVYTVGAFSGAHLNPAVTLGLAAIGKFKWPLVAGYILAQVLGGIIG